MSLPSFTENWFSLASCATLADLVASVEDVPGRIVELGSWEGRSTLAIARATSRPIHAVDHWQGAATDTYQREQVKTRDVFARWQANLADYTQVSPYRMDWAEYHAADDTPVALVFIDADHTKRQVTEQIDAFRPLMSPGGIICGDDYPMRPVRHAVADRLRQRRVEGAVWWWVAP